MAGVPRPFVIEKLAKAHELDHFDCGVDSLTVWLLRFARVNSRNDSARVYVARRPDDYRAVGYHALAAGEVARDAVPERIGRGLAGHQIGRAHV